MGGMRQSRREVSHVKPSLELAFVRHGRGAWSSSTSHVLLLY
jgi:hypothetical protein